MGLPAKRRTKQSKRQRASHFALEIITLSTCPKCKKSTLPHHICKFCGYYQGVDILKLDTRTERKKKKAKKQEEKSKGS
ncbi:MAG: 50S ribosomal protein L32 [Patescibacteria group bacterium]